MRRPANLTQFLGRYRAGSIGLSTVSAAFTQDESRISKALAAGPSGRLTRKENPEHKPWRVSDGLCSGFSFRVIRA